MSLHPRRAVAYLAGACTGGFTTAAAVAARAGRGRAAVRYACLALVAGACSVLFEETAPDRASD